MKGATWRLLIPGLLVAATGVGAGDLATSALTGSRLGVTILWAVLAGCAVKFLLNEGVARYQLEHDETLLFAVIRRAPRALRWLLLAYFVTWSFLVGAALTSACGVVAHAILPLGDAVSDKIAYGVVASLLGWALAARGGLAWFERGMALCTGVMVASVLYGAIALDPDWGAVAAGISIPRIPAGEGRSWTLALIGGIGGTVTVLCYGYWIEERGRRSLADLRVCRIDLAAAYAVTAVFGLGMVMIGSRVSLAGSGGATLMVKLADALDPALGSVGRWLFVAGAFGAVASSLLGVWQSVPYLFADALAAARGTRVDAASLRASRGYRGYQAALALVPLLGLLVGFASMQKAYAIAGSLFLPMLALALLALGRNGVLRALLLVGIVLLYGAELTLTIVE